MNQELKNKLQNIPGIEIEINKDLSKFSTMRLKAFGDVITVTNKDALISFQKIMSEAQCSFLVLGLGANLLLKEKSEVPYLMLKFNFDQTYLEEVRSNYILPASVRLSSLTSHAAKFGLKGWEVFTGVPATIGGAVFMNAGTGLGEICSVLQKVYIIDKSGSEIVHTVTKESFSYRKNNFLKSGDVVYQVEMFHNGVSESIKSEIKDYLQKRNASQPMSEWTCGCVFKNSSYESKSCAAGKFIDIIGLKGFQIGGIRVSDKHGNFMENYSEASFEDVNLLIKLVQDELYLQYGVKFELEVKV